ncbi:MAG: alpha/beta fold hydrolase [Anaerolineae bacterium]|nr:alpha/beta fold hydrolase [Anaerolineae bacterium]
MFSVGQIWVNQTHPEPFELDGTRTGVLLLHGFGGTPREMVLIAGYLHSRGLGVNVPLLPGHGTTLAQMNRVRWREWLRKTEREYIAMKTQYQQVCVAGFSMGALLTLWLASRYNEIPAIITYAPALKISNKWLFLSTFLKWFVRIYPKKGAPNLLHPETSEFLGSFYGGHPVSGLAQLYHLQQYVAPLIPKIHTPALVIYSHSDRSIDPQCGPKLIACLSKSTTVESLVLDEVGHVLVVDAGWEKVAEATYKFIQEQVTV